MKKRGKEGNDPNQFHATRYTAAVYISLNLNNAETFFVKFSYVSFHRMYKNVMIKSVKIRNSYSDSHLTQQESKKAHFPKCATNIAVTSTINNILFLL